MPDRQRYDDLPDDVREWLEELRKSDIAEIKDAVDLIHEVKRASKMVRWIIVGLIGLASVVLQVTDGIPKILEWFKPHAVN